MNPLWRDILVNVVSDLLFVVLVSVLAMCLYWAPRLLRRDPASRFFGLRLSEPGVIYVSGFPHERVTSRKVANALEYDAAIRLRDALRPSALGSLAPRLVRWLAGVVGQDIPIPEWNIAVAPLEPVDRLPPERALISIGGPVANRLTAYFLADQPQFRFDLTSGKYEERAEGRYVPIEPSGGVAIVEKVVVGDTTAILTHGFGEEHTAAAAQYLARNWRAMFRKHGQKPFGFRVT